MQRQREKGVVNRHKARLAICGSRETDVNEDSSSLVANFTVANLIMSLALQNGWFAKHLDFKEAYRYGRLDQPLFAKLRAIIIMQSNDRNMLGNFAEVSTV